MTSVLNEAQAEAFCGVLVVEVLTAKPSGLSPEKSYVVHTSFTKSLTAGGRYRTTKAAGKNLTWNTTWKLVQDDELYLNLYESSLFPLDDLIGTGSLSLKTLFEGERLDGVEVDIFGKPPKVKAEMMPPPLATTPAKTEQRDAPIPAEQKASAIGPKVATAVLRVYWKDDSVPEMGDNADRKKGAFIRGNASAGLIEKNLKNETKKPPAIELPTTDGNDYTVRIRVHKARNLQSIKENELYDLICMATIAGESKSTDTADSTNNPIWDEDLVFTFEKVGHNWFNTPMLIQVTDRHRVRPNTVIGSFQLDCATIYQENAKHFAEHKWYVLHSNVMEGHVVGFIKLSISVLDMRKDPTPDPTPDTTDEGDEESIVTNLVSGPGSRFEEMTLYCDVFRAEDLPAMDLALGPFQKGLADPYVKFQFGTRVVSTPVVNDNLSPVWNCCTRLPLLLPSLTKNLTISIWDADRAGSDDLIGMVRFPLDDLMEAGRQGLPAFQPRFVNFYGGPRGCDADFNSSYAAMSKGDLYGVDYRGRLLLRMTGSRSNNQGAGPLARVAVQETVVEFTAEVQILQLSMIPSGTFYFRVSVGMFDALTNERETHAMQNSSLHAIFFGEGVRIDGKVAVIVPQREDDPTIESQIPDIILHLIPKGKDVPYAAIRFPATKLLPSQEAQYLCDTMHVFTDPDKTTVGEQPSDPLVQARFGMYLRKAKGPFASSVPLGESVKNLEGVNPSAPELFKLLACVYSARQIPAGDDSGLSDPFIRISWADGASQTGTKLETLNPIYNELLMISTGAKDPFPDIVVEIWDWDFFGSNTFLAKKVISIAEARDEENAGQTKWFRGFTDSRGKPLPDCEVLLNLELVKVVENNRTKWDHMPRERFLKKVGSSETYTGWAIPEPKQLPTAIYKLNCRIFSLRHMRSFHLMEIKCPNVGVEVAGHCVEVDKIYGANPDFNREFDMYVELPENPEYLPRLNFQVWENRFGPRSLVGGASCPIDSKNFAPQWKAQALLTADNAVAERLYKINVAKGLKEKQALSKTAVKALGNVAKFKAVGTELVVQDRLKRRKATEAKTRKVDQNSDLYEALLRDEGDVPEPGSLAHLSDTTTERHGATIPPKPGSLVGPGEEMTEKRDPTHEEVKAATSEVSQLFLLHEEEERYAKLQEEADRLKKEEENRLWFDRFDPDGLDVKPEFQVSRLGNMSGILPPGLQEPTLEAYYGPFDDEVQKLKVYRGWGDGRKIAGTILYDLTVVKMKEPPPGIVAVATSIPKPGKSAAEVRFIPPKEIASRKPMKFVAHIYIIACRNLAAKDASILGKLSDPYPVIQLMNKSTKKDTITLKCRDDTKYQTLNPEYFLVKEMRGIIPKQDLLRLSFFDYDKIGRDELIGYTEIDLESRWHSRRGYKNRNLTTLKQGTYTETRWLRNDQGQLQGSVEMWVDLYDAEYQVIPRPIDITPPPPIPLELRVIIWNTRDVILQETNWSGEAMTDIYVRAWLDGMQSDMQQTDVHYRSLDGNGNFNWRMNFPFVFEPRSKKIMPSGANKTFKSFFRVRKEAEMCDPILHVQIWDNDLLPGTDDFIGECNLRLMDLRPIISRRDPNTLIGILGAELSYCCNCYPFNQCCRYRKPPPEEELTLAAKQKRAQKEAQHDREAQEKKWRNTAKQKVEALRTIRPEYTPQQLARYEKLIFDDLRRNAAISVFQPFLPSSWKKKQNRKTTKDSAYVDGSSGDEEANGPESRTTCAGNERDRTTNGERDGADAGTRKDEDGVKPRPSIKDRLANFLPGGKGPADGRAKNLVSGGGISSLDDLPKVSESPKYWFPCRGPNGGGRVGDVQISFQLVRADLLQGENPDRSLLAGKGRSAPNALPHPKRPDTSFFWLSSPWKSAVYILWKRYKWHIITIVCLGILSLLIWVFVSEGVQTKARHFFNTGNFDPDSSQTTIQIQVVNSSSYALPNPAPRELGNGTESSV